MRLFATSSTVTGTALPSSANTRVMPILQPTNPMLIVVVLCVPPISIDRRPGLLCLLQLDLDVDSRRQVELHQLVDRLVGRIDDVHQPQVRADLELVARRLVDVGRAQYVRSEEH